MGFLIEPKRKYSQFLNNGFRYKAVNCISTRLKKFDDILPILTLFTNVQTDRENVTVYAAFCKCRSVVGNN